MSYKPWQKKVLRFPKKAIIVFDDNAGRAAMCSRLIIDRFSCQSARVTNENEFIKILQKAQREQCVITGIISDDHMEIPGSEIIDRFANGYYAEYYGPIADPKASSTAFLLITGDHNLNYQGVAGVQKTMVFHLGAWRRFLEDPQGSAVGGLIASWLEIEQPASPESAIREEMENSRLAGMKGAAAFMVGRRNDHDDEASYRRRALLGFANSLLKKNL